MSEVAVSGVFAQELNSTDAHELEGTSSKTLGISGAFEFLNRRGPNWESKNTSATLAGAEKSSRSAELSAPAKSASVELKWLSRESWRPANHRHYRGSSRTCSYGWPNARPPGDRRTSHHAQYDQPHRRCPFHLHCRGQRLSLPAGEGGWLDRIPGSTHCRACREGPDRWAASAPPARREKCCHRR